MRGSIIALIGVGVACRGDSRPEPARPPPAPPALGEQSPAMLSHFAATCPNRVYWASESSLGCSLDETLKSYSVRFDPEFRVLQIGLLFHTSDQDLLRTFDQVIGPVVPTAIRDRLRASITTAPPDMRDDGGQRDGTISDTNLVSVQWLRSDARGVSRKTVMWHYVMPTVISGARP